MDPKTRASLVLRLRDPADDAAWGDFVQIYEPMLLRLATRWGLQECDASEVVQETLLAVAKSIPTYQSQEHPGAFRGWLAAITRNKLADHLKQRSRQPTGSGDTDVHRWMDQQAQTGAPESIWDWQHKREVYQWAAAKVRQQVAPLTWQAFHRTEVLQEPVTDVARDLGMRIGMIYVARSRVMSRLRKTVQQWSEPESCLSTEKPK